MLYWFSKIFIDQLDAKNQYNLNINRMQRNMDLSNSKKLQQICDHNLKCWRELLELHISWRGYQTEACNTQEHNLLRTDRCRVLISSAVTVDLWDQWKEVKRQFLMKGNCRTIINISFVVMMLFEKKFVT